MRSTWGKSVWRWLGKEARCELRSKHGVYSSFLFGLMAVVAATAATFDQKLNPSLAAGFLCLTLIFAAVVSVPRAFLVEEDQRTFDLARLAEEPSVVYTGKTVYCFVTSALTGPILALIYAVLTHVEVFRWDVLLLGSLVFSGGLSLCLSFCSALVVGAENRYVLAGVVALPLLLPFVFSGVGGLQFAFGEGAWGASLQNFAVMVGYGVGVGGLGPVLVGEVWGVRQDPRRRRQVSHNRKEA